MRRFDEGDRVRVDIPDKTDPDHDRLHGKRGIVVDIIEDDAGLETGDLRDSYSSVSRLMAEKLKIFDGETSDQHEITN